MIALIWLAVVSISVGVIYEVALFAFRFIGLFCVYQILTICCLLWDSFIYRVSSRMLNMMLKEKEPSCRAEPERTAHSEVIFCLYTFCFS